MSEPNRWTRTLLAAACALATTVGGYQLPQAWAGDGEDKSGQEDDDDDDDEDEERERRRRRRKREREREREREAEREREKAAAAAAAAKKEENKPDHEAAVGKVGVGFFGTSAVPIASATPGGTGKIPAVNPGAPDSLTVPAIGIRYWFSSTMALDIGLGAWVSSGEDRSTTSASDDPTRSALLFHLGVPLSLASSKHLSLQLTPEVHFGYAWAAQEPAVQADPPPDASLSGYRFDLGARIGAEVHWGFAGLPELSLEGSVGLFLSAQGTDATVDTVHASEDNLVFATAEYGSPWDVFTQHVRARYYF